MRSHTYSPSHTVTHTHTHAMQARTAADESDEGNWTLGRTLAEIHIHYADFYGHYLARRIIPSQLLNLHWIPREELGRAPDVVLNTVAAIVRKHGDSRRTMDPSEAEERLEELVGAKFASLEFAKGAGLREFVAGRRCVLDINRDGNLYIPVPCVEID